MNAKVVLHKDGREKTIEITEKHVVITTNYNTTFDAEGVYRDTKAYFVKRGWKKGKPAVFSKIENVTRRFRPHKVLGHRIKNDGTVGGE